eukprot:5070199-Pleurochrysis_carterae.AAC.8
MAIAEAASICIFFSLVALFDLELKGVDIVRAFTQAMLSNADLYLLWHWTLERTSLAANQHGLLKSYGVMQFCGKPCIFTLKRDVSFLLAVVYIYNLDIAYANKDKTLFDQSATAYGKHFSSEISAGMDKFIGLKITRNRDARTYTLSQQLYIEEVDCCFLPNKTLRKSTAAPASFTDKAQQAKGTEQWSRSILASSSNIPSSHHV